MGVALVFIFIGLVFYLFHLNSVLKDLKVSLVMFEKYGTMTSQILVKREIRTTENKITFVFVGLIACLIFYLIFIFTN